MTNITVAPNNTEIEGAVLGSALTNPKATSKIIHLTIDHFYKKKNQLIFNAIIKLYSEGQHIDVITVTDYLKKFKLLEEAGGSYYITGLMDQPTTGKIETYTNLLQEYHVKRNVQVLLDRFNINETRNGSLKVFKEKLEDAIAELPGETDVPGLKLHTYEEYISDTSDPPDEVISNGILPERSVMILGGQPKSGKSILMMNVAYCLASGTPWLHFDIPIPRRTLILQGENSYYNQRDRLQRINNAQNWVRNAEKVRDGYLMLSDPFSVKINEFKGYKKVESIIDKHDIEVIIFDPLIYYHSLDENSNADMGIVMEQFRTLANNLNVCVIIIHHTKKPVINDAPGGMVLRGASSIFGAVDSSIILSRNTDNSTGETEYYLNFDIRNGENPERIYLEMDQPTLWISRRDKNVLTSEQWIVDSLLSVESDGIEKKLLIEEGMSKGYSKATLYRQLDILIRKEIAKTDGKKRNTIVWHHKYITNIPF